MMKDQLLHFLFLPCCGLDLPNWCEKGKLVPASATGLIVMDRPHVLEARWNPSVFAISGIAALIVLAAVFLYKRLAFVLFVNLTVVTSSMKYTCILTLGHYSTILAGGTISFRKRSLH